MKVSVRVDNGLPRRLRYLLDHIDSVLAAPPSSPLLLRELESELGSVAALGRAADPETRRDALERAVRRVWGATL